MKNIKYLFVMFFAVMLSVSCSSDDDSVSELNDSALVGTWGITLLEEEFNVRVVMTFNDNNSGRFFSSVTYEGETETENENFNWSTSGDKLTISTGDATDISTYSIIGNKLKITDSTGKIMVLTKE